MTLKQIRIRFYIYTLLAAALGLTSSSYNSQFFLALGFAGFACYYLSRWNKIEKAAR